MLLGATPRDARWLRSVRQTVLKGISNWSSSVEK